MNDTFKDLFSVQADDYVKYRPTYSRELFKFLASLTENHDLAWDVGTGNGQAARELINDYKKVIATDPSEKQLEKAIKHENITYQISTAESSPLQNNSVDLITVAQAFHWFKQKEFFAEVKRVAKPNAVLAIWCYETAKINDEVNAKIFELYDSTLGPYWEKERKLVEHGYKNEFIPFTEIITPPFTLTAQWDLNHLTGYLNTWSALQSYIKKQGYNPLKSFYPELQVIWGPPEQKKTITWNLGLRVSRIPG